MRTTSGIRIEWLGLVIGLLLAPCAQAADGTWTNIGSGNWSDTTKWKSGIVADGAGCTAAISANIGANTYVITQDTARSVGTLIFSDSSGQDNYWTLSDGGNSANILTLTNLTSATPMIIASNKNNYLDVTLAGSQGLLVKAQDTLTIGTITYGLYLRRMNTYTGVTTISRGVLIAATNAPVGAPGAVGQDTSAIQIGDAGSTLATNVLGLLLEKGVSFERDIQVNNYGSNVMVGAASDTTGNARYLKGNLKLNRSIFFGCGGSNGKLIQTNGVISGSGGIMVSPFGNSGSTVEFYTTNTYSGDTIISRGTINIYTDVPNGDNGAFGNATSDVVLGDANTSTSDILVQLKPGCVFSRNIWVKAVGSSGAVTFYTAVAGNPSPVYAGNIRADRSITLKANTSSSKTTIFSGVISGTGSVVVATANNIGTIMLQNTNTYTGGTTINLGTLQLSTNIAGYNAGLPDTGQIMIMTNNSNGWMDFNNISDTVGGLAGIGMVKLGTAVVTNAEGISPGTNLLAVGTLTATGTTGRIVLGASSTNLFHLLAPGNADQVVIQGNANLTLGGTLKIDQVDTNAIAYGDYTLFDLAGGTSTGSFTQLIMPAGYKGTITTSGNDIVLTVAIKPPTGTSIYLR